MTDATTQPLSQFIEQHGVTINSEWVDRNPNMDNDGQKMNHYKVILRNKAGRQLTTFFSMGLGLSGEPKIADVLDCLASDSAGVENARDFEDWCGEYGYDTDSRKAERTYRITERQAQKLKQFLGEDAYDQLLWHTERE